jgi:translation initiation factor IF-2
MSEDRVIRINKVLRELNISLERAVDYLKDKGIAIDANPNAKIWICSFFLLLCN